MPHPSYSYGVLSAIGSLRSLALSQCAALPACLSELHSLESLSIDDIAGVMEHEAGEPAAILAAALPRLTHLTRVMLVSRREGATPEEPPPPYPLAPVLLAGLAGRSQLSGLVVDTGAPAGVHLPAGLSGLTELAVPAQLLADSLPALKAATGVQLLGMLRWDALAEDAGIEAALLWAAQLPQLERLMIEVDEEQGEDAMAALGSAIRETAQPCCRNARGFEVLVRPGPWWARKSGVE